MKIRLKILSGFLVIVAMLTIAAVFGIYEFRKLSHSVDSLLTDNYASIVACTNMLEGLEREDSGILLFIMGRKEMGIASVSEGDSIFTRALQIAQNNITESNEEAYVNEIILQYSKYNKMWELLRTNNDESSQMEWFSIEVHPLFKEVKNSIKSLMMLNQTSMFNESTRLREKAQRAVMPGFVAVIAALFFAILFNFFINYYFVSPIVRLIKSVNNYRPMGKEIDAGIETKDELKKLEEAVRELVVKLNRKNQ
jgi:hypothetical protein